MTDTKALPGYEFLKFILENIVEDKDSLVIDIEKIISSYTLPEKNNDD